VQKNKDTQKIIFETPIHMSRCFFMLRIGITFFLTLAVLSSYAQYSLPKCYLLKKDKVKSVSVVRHTMPTTTVDGLVLKQEVQKPPMLIAKYFINKQGKPDSMYSISQGVAHRKEVFGYSKNQLTNWYTVNHKGDTITAITEEYLGKKEIRRVEKRNGQTTSISSIENGIVLRTYRKSNAMIFGFDSMSAEYNPATKQFRESYFNAGELTHQLLRTWYTNEGKDSFNQRFIQKRKEAGLMPSHNITLAVNKDGKMIIPDGTPFKSQFEALTYDATVKKYQSLESSVLTKFNDEVRSSESALSSRTFNQNVFREKFVYSYEYY